VVGVPDRRAIFWGNVDRQDVGWTPLVAVIFWFVLDAAVGMDDFHGWNE